jgi:Transposase DDE domain group 1
MLTVRKTIRVTRGQELLLPETRYFFYISNLRDVDAREIVREANDRCNQENLNSHLKSGVHALRAPLKSLVSNWAYMVMTSLAWTFKAWFATLASTGDSDTSSALRRRLLTMEFRTFVNNLMSVPALVIETGRRIVVRLLTKTPWTPHLIAAQVCFRE